MKSYAISWQAREWTNSKHTVAQINSVNDSQYVITIVAARHEHLSGNASETKILNEKRNLTHIDYTPLHTFYTYNENEFAFICTQRLWNLFYIILIIRDCSCVQWSLSCVLHLLLPFSGFIYQNNRRVSGKFKLIACTVEQKLFLTEKSMHTYYLVEFLTRSMYSTLFELCEWSFFAVRDKHALVHANTQNYIFIIVL